MIKKLTAVVIMVIVGALVVSGCVSPSSSPVSSTPSVGQKQTTSVSANVVTSGRKAQSPSPSPMINVASLDANEFNKRYSVTHPNETIAKRFTKTVNERGHSVFSGMQKDIPSEVSFQPQHDWEIKIEICKDKVDAQHTQQQRIQQAKQVGYSYIDIVDYQGVNIWEGERPILNNIEEMEYKFIELHPPDDLQIGYYVEDTTFWGRA